MQEHKITIKLGPNGLTFSGPIHDKILCYGMLTAATDMVRDHRPAPIEIANHEQIRALNGVKN